MAGEAIEVIEATEVIEEAVGAGIETIEEAVEGGGEVVIEMTGEEEDKTAKKRSMLINKLVKSPKIKS